MKLKDITRLFVKIFLYWFTMLFVIFFGLKYVNNNENIPERTRYDLIDDKKIIGKKKIIKKYNDNKKELEELSNSYENIIRIEKAKKYLTNIVNEAVNNKHYSANEENISYKKLCDFYPKYCSIIDVDKDFTEKQKVYFTAITIYFIRYLKEIFPNIENEIYYIKLQKEKKGRRGYAGHHSIVMNIKEKMTYKQFLEVLTHEMGHIVDLGVVVGNSWFKDKTFTEFGKQSFAKNDPSLDFYKLSWNSEKIKNPYIYAKDFVSGYGLTDPFEDFAESFNMYVNHNTVFIKMAKESNILKKKYNYINKLMNGKYLSSDRKFNYRLGFRPRDTTKMK